mmetsp:Transcript_30665/g.105384  ORF Transcript_30665/g.105384 Transcript_30665/m.105384 type:complete len:151 (-) Transcript_30665:99-551(-)
MLFFIAALLSAVPRAGALRVARPCRRRAALAQRRFTAAAAVEAVDDDGPVLIVDSEVVSDADAGKMDRLQRRRDVVSGYYAEELAGGTAAAPSAKARFASAAGEATALAYLAISVAWYGVCVCALLGRTTAPAAAAAPAEKKKKKKKEAK